MSLSRLIPFLSILVGVLAVAAPGCGSDGLTGEKACQRDAESRCTQIKRCYGTAASFRLQRDYGDEETCLARNKQACLESVERRDTGSTPLRAEQCAVAREAQSCSDFLAGLPLPEAQCPEIVGPLPLGAPCISSNQCRSRNCKLTADKLCGACAEQAFPSGVCDGTGDCKTGLTCLTMTDPVTMTSSKTCVMVQRVKLDMPCNDTSVCEGGLSCVGASRSMMMDGTCKLLAKEGEACDASRKVAPDCDGAMGVVCNRTTLKCDRRILAGTNEGCGSTETGGDINCKRGGNCKRPLDRMTTTRPLMGTCVALAGPGQPCAASSSDGPSCLPPARCVLDGIEATTGMCQARDYEACAAPSPVGGDASAP